MGGATRRGWNEEGKKEDLTAGVLKSFVEQTKPPGIGGLAAPPMARAVSWRAGKGSVGLPPTGISTRVLGGLQRAKREIKTPCWDY